MRKVNSLIVYVLIILLNMSCAKNSSEKKLQKLINEFEAVFAPIEKEYNDTYFKASINGNEDAYKKAAELNLKMTQILADSARFDELKKLKKEGDIEDELLIQQLNKLYNKCIKYQGNKAKTEELVKRESKLEQRYATYRAKLNGKEVSDNSLDSILKTSVNSEELKEAWLVSKQIGEEVKNEAMALVKMRNEIARELGYDNYHQMSLLISEQEPEEIEALFDELDKLTRSSFKKLKNQIDSYFATRYNISTDELMPWHYQNRFFQEAPQIYEADFDKYYADKDIVEVVENYYSEIGLDVDEILENSDLYEKPGKYQHAYCMHVDRSGDVRIITNIRPDLYWTNTLLHELGHAVYDLNIDMELPYILREPAHIFTTEAIAMLFGRLSSNPEWMMENLELSDSEYESIRKDALNISQLQQLVFSRWSQVMFRFEKSMYENPDQDLNKLWWDLVEKYQMIKRPQNRDQADWAAKIHIALYPCYYHNYLMGELLASQLGVYIENNVLLEAQTGFTGDHAIGEYLISDVFEPGALYHWNDMIEQATGEKLTAKYYAEEFVME